jgi:hypothetical protein
VVLEFAHVFVSGAASSLPLAVVLIGTSSHKIARLFLNALQQFSIWCSALRPEPPATRPVMMITAHQLAEDLPISSTMIKVKNSTPKSNLASSFSVRRL